MPDFDAPMRGREVNGVWVPDAAIGAKSDRSITGLTPQERTSFSGVLAGAYQASNRFRDYDSYLQSVKTVPWVWAAVSVIAYNFARNPYQYLDGDGQEVEDQYDPFLRLWNRPNPKQTGFHFREMLMYYVQLLGEAFISLEEWDADDQPHEMYLPNPARMRVHQDPRTGEIDAYFYDADGSGNARGMIPYLPHEIIHLKYANPLDPLRGLGAVEAMETTLNIISEMTGTSLSYWKSGGRITGVLQTEQPVDDLTFNRLVQRWQDFTRVGKDRARFRTAILEQGLKYQPIAEGLRGIDLTKLEDSKRDEILANFGVPKQKLGIYDASTGYKGDDADRFFYGETMEPIFDRVEDGLAMPLVEVFYPDRIFRFARRNYEDDSVKLNNSKIMQSLGFTYGEICDYLGVDPPDDIRKDMLFPTPGATPYTLKQLVQLSNTEVEHPQAEPPPPPKPPAPPKLPPGGGGGPINPARIPGQVPLAGTSPIATNTQNGRQGAVDGNGHLPNNPIAGAPSAKFITEENVKYLAPEEVRALRNQYHQELAAAREVKRQFRRPVDTKGLARLNVKARSAVGAPVPRTAPDRSPASGELMRRATAAIRTRLTAKYKPVIKDAFTKQRQALTPVLKDAIDAFKRINAGSGSDEHKKTERVNWLRDRWPSKPLAEAIIGLHVEAANDGWRAGKRSLGFGGKGFSAWEAKALPTRAQQEDFVSPFLAERYLEEGDGEAWAAIQAQIDPTLQGLYGRLPGRRITGVDDTTISDVESLVSEGLRRGYSSLQIANGNRDENFDGVASIFDDEYRAELIARTESMFAGNFGATNSYADSGVDQVEAMDGSDDPECAARDGQVFDLDPDEGRAVDDDGEVVEDHPNGTLAWAPVVSNRLVETGALDDTGEVTNFEGEDAAEWEFKEGTGQDNNPQGANQHRTASGKGIKHTHANGTKHTHVGGGKQHTHKGKGPKKVKPDTGSPDKGGEKPVVVTEKAVRMVALEEHPDFGWGLKSPDGAFFTDEEGVVHPIRNAEGYDSSVGDRQRGRSGGSATGGAGKPGRVPQVSPGRAARLGAAILQPPNNTGVSGGLRFVYAYSAARAAGLSHEETLKAAADTWNARGGSQVSPSDVQGALDTQARSAGFRATSTSTAIEVASTAVGRTVGTTTGTATTGSARTGTGQPPGNGTGQVQGTGPGGRVTSADRILAAHPTGGVNPEVKALYGRELAKFKEAGGTTVALKSGDPRIAQLGERFREMRPALEAQNISGRVRTGISFMASNFRQHEYGNAGGVVVSLDKEGNPVSAVGYEHTAGEWHVGVAGSAGTVPGAGMAMQHALATEVAKAGTKLGSSYLPDAKAAHASWGRTISSGYGSQSGWSKAAAVQIAAIKPD